MQGTAWFRSKENFSKKPEIMVWGYLIWNKVIKQFVYKHSWCTMKKVTPALFPHWHNYLIINKKVKREALTILNEIRKCTKILQEIMIFQKLAKTHFGQYIVYSSKQYFEISGKIYFHCNDIPNTTSPWFFLFREA